MSIQGIVFDLDHTLYDRKETLIKFGAILEEQFPTGLSKSELDVHMFEADKHLYHEDYTAAGQKNVHKYLQSVLPSCPPQEEYLYLFDHFFGSCAIPYSFTYDVLTALKKKGYSIGMVTNGNTISQNLKINTLQLRPYFDDIIISGEVGFSKPDKQIFELSAKQLALPIEGLLFVGDNARLDAAGPMAAGMKAAWIRQERGWPADCPQPDYTITDIRELLNFL